MCQTVNQFKVDRAYENKLFIMIDNVFVVSISFACPGMT